MIAHRRCFLWALSTSLCVAALVVTAASGRIVAEAQDSQPPPSPPVVSSPKKAFGLPKEGFDGSTPAPPSGGAGPATKTAPQNPSSTNNTESNQSPPLPHDQPPPSAPLPVNTPGKLPQKDPPATPSPLVLSSPPPPVLAPPVPVSSPPPTGKQEKPPPPNGHRTEAPPNAGSGAGNGDGEPKKGEGRADWIPVESEKVDKCTGTHFKCTFPLDGCTMPSEKDHGVLFLYLRNTGENSMNLTVSVAPSTEIGMQGLPKSGAGQLRDSINAKDIPKIFIKTGGQTCSPFSKSAPTSDLFKQFQSYTARMTPIYGAYAFFLTALIAGGAWACCSFARRRRRRDSGVPYQQLEMGGIQSQHTVLADTTVDNTADGWGQGWDDDWDDEEAVTRPQESGNPSTNGVGSKSTNKDGWDDWDD